MLSPKWFASRAAAGLLPARRLRRTCATPTAPGWLIQAGWFLCGPACLRWASSAV